jgi:mannose-6-phosphate isomerase-like protein (cupin superfamily)
MKAVSMAEPIQYYAWGEGCEGWTMVENEGLSVKLERMPPGSAERLHMHNRAQQFFYVLKGEAVFEIEGERMQVAARQGIHIRAGQAHRIKNEGGIDLEFVLASQPSTINDRILC